MIIFILQKYNLLYILLYLQYVQLTLMIIKNNYQKDLFGFIHK